MSERLPRRIAVELPWSALLKIIAAIALVWIWLTLSQLVLRLAVAVLLAVTLDPVVRRLQRRGLSRAAGATLVCFVLLVAIAGFFYLTWSSLSDQGQMLGRHHGDFEKNIAGRVPAFLRNALGGSGGGSVESLLASYGLRFVRAAAAAVLVFGLAFILRLYLLIEGPRTHRRLIAFVPSSRRARTEVTAEEARTVIFAYVAGNVATSICATPASSA